MSLRIRFGAPRSNWIPLGVSSRSIAFDEVLSSVPSDPLRGIADAALAAAGGQSGGCVLFAGPEEYALAFQPAARGIRLEIVRWPDHRREEGRGALVFQATGSPATVLVPVWRGLRELGGRWPAEPDFWRAPFPEETVARLGGALGAC